VISRPSESQGSDRGLESESELGLRLRCSLSWALALGRGEVQRRAQSICGRNYQLLRRWRADPLHAVLQQPFPHQQVAATAAPLWRRHPRSSEACQRRQLLAEGASLACQLLLASAARCSSIPGTKAARRCAPQDGQVGRERPGAATQPQVPLIPHGLPAGHLDSRRPSLGLTWQLAAPACRGADDPPPVHRIPGSRSEKSISSAPDRLKLIASRRRLAVASRRCSSGTKTQPLLDTLPSRASALACPQAFELARRQLTLLLNGSCRLLRSTACVSSEPEPASSACGMLALVVSCPCRHAIECKLFARPG